MLIFDFWFLKKRQETRGKILINDFWMNDCRLFWSADLVFDFERRGKRQKARFWLTIFWMNDCRLFWREDLVFNFWGWGKRQEARFWLTIADCFEVKIWLFIFEDEARDKRKDFDERFLDEQLTIADCFEVWFLIVDFWFLIFEEDTRFWLAVFWINDCRLFWSADLVFEEEARDKR